MVVNIGNGYTTGRRDPSSAGGFSSVRDREHRRGWAVGTGEAMGEVVGYSGLPEGRC